MRNRENCGKYMDVIALLVLSVGLTIPLTVSARPQTVGLFQNDPAAFNGYTLFSKRGSNRIYLIDNDGRLVHSWNHGGSPIVLLENGNLLVGEGGCKEIAWDGTVVWDYLYPSQHHDFERLPNGNVLMITDETKTTAEAIAAGRSPALVGDEGLRALHIIEVEPTGPTSGTIVWEWHVWDHLIQDQEETQANYGVVGDHPELVDINLTINGSSPDWLHTNALHYNPELDQIIVSPRHFSELWVIDHSTTTAGATGHTGGNSGLGGDILYRWGNPQAYRAGTEGDQKLFLQHDTQWIEPGLPGEGHILIFNNGPGRGYSSVDEIVPPVDGYNYVLLTPGSAYGPAQPIWTYTAEPPTDFFSHFISGAQRLPNGNTLINDGAHGTFFEVTPEGQTVWKYVNPVIRTGPLYQGDPVPDRSDGSPGLSGTTDNRVFRCYRYAPDYPGLAGRDLTPGHPIELYDTDVTLISQINKFGTRFDRRTGHFSMMATWKNTSAEPYRERMRLVIESITPDTVTVDNADGTTVEGKPYYDYSNLIGDGQLDPRETSAAKLLVFNNPNRARFTFDVSLWAVVPSEENAAPPIRPAISKAQRIRFAIPVVSALAQNFPNPFNPETWIPYELAQAGDVTISIYDAQGRFVRTLEVGHREVGQYVTREKAAYWDGRNRYGERVGSGVYFYYLRAGDFQATRKMVILK